MGCRRGFTIIETFLSITIFTIMMATILSLFVNSEAAVSMADASLTAQSDWRAAVNAMQDDLSGAQIYSYYAGALPNDPVYIKFRRLKSGIIDAAWAPDWEDQVMDPRMFMYIWCPNGSSSNAVNGVNVCGWISPSIGTSTAIRRQLLLVQSQSATTSGSNQEPWRPVRGVASGLQHTELDDLERGLTLSVTNIGTGLAIPQVTNLTCALVNGERCVNQAGTPFGLPGYSAANPLRVQVEVTLRIRARTSRGHVVSIPSEPAVPARILMRNRQNT